MNVAQDMISKLRCRLGRHAWGGATSGVNEAHQTCGVCGRTRIITLNQSSPDHRGGHAGSPSGNGLDSSSW